MASLCDHVIGADNKSSNFTAQNCILYIMYNTYANAICAWYMAHIKLKWKYASIYIYDMHIFAALS